MDERTSQLIDNNFPFDNYRQNQKNIIYDILKGFTKYDNVILESPVGSGKSVIAATVAKIFRSSYYITIQKILMEQIMDDFDWMVPVKGRNSYPCWFMNDHLNSNKKYFADNGKCIQNNKTFLEICKGNCEYNSQINKAMQADHALFNFYSFLFQRSYANRFINPKNLLIVDESHNIEEQIMNFVEVKIDGNDINQKLPEYDDISLYISYFKMIDLEKLLINKIIEDREKLISIVGNDLDNIDMSSLDKEDAEIVYKLIKSIDKYNSIVYKYNGLMEYVYNIRCVCDFADNCVIIKPLFASYHTPKLIFPAGNKRLFMSATILHPKLYCENVGIDSNNFKFIRIPHTFPVKNRLIHLDYAGPMDFKSKNKTMPKLYKKIDKIMDKHKNEKGIIHCQSFSLLESIRDNINRSNRSRLIDQTMFNSKEELLLHHSRQKNSVIIAPAMHEGLDLKNDMSRFQVLSKIPWPSIQGNRQLEARMKDNWNYYVWLCALKLLQSTGRSIRSEDDYASTYIIDSGFDKFFNMADNAGMLPDWFVESIVVD